MKKWREAAAIVTALALLIALTWGLGKLLLPVRTSYGATWDQYQMETPNSLDVLYFGSSIVYCDVIPAVVWEESGLTSYVMAGPEQTLSVTYYYLRQACETQSPQAVVLELNGMFFPPYTQLAKPNFLYMPWGENRVRATLEGAEREDWPELFFPLYGDHDRIYTVTPAEIKQNLRKQRDDYAGYTLLTDATPMLEQPPREYDTDTDAYRKNVAYLRKIADFCAQRDIRLVCYLAPVFCQIPQTALDTLEQDLSTIPHALFFNCNSGDWPSFDPQTDWHDFLHLNLYGAVPFSQRLAQELKRLELTPSGAEPELWQSRSDIIHALLADAPGDR